MAPSLAILGVGLHLVAPLGFEITNLRLKRAGLDYWPYVTVKVHPSWQDFLSFYNDYPGQKRMLAYSKKGDTPFARPGMYRPGDWLLFGAETTGLPAEAIAAAEASGGRVLRIPIVETHVRSLNLAVAAGIGLYEAIRQIDGPV